MSNDHRKTEYGVFVKIGEASHDGYQGKRRTTAWIEAFPVVLNYQYRSKDDPFWRYCGGLAGEEYEWIVGTAMLDSHYEEQTVGSSSLRAREVYSAELYAVERLAKSMRKIQAKFTAMYAIEGNPLSVGQFVARLARAIGAKVIVTEASARAFQNTGERWRKHDLAVGISVVDRMIDEWKAANNPVPADTVSA